MQLCSALLRAVPGKQASTPLDSPPPLPPRVHPASRFLHTFIALACVITAFGLFVAETLASLRILGVWVGRDVTRHLEERLATREASCL